MRRLLYLLVIFLIFLIVFSILINPELFFMNITSTLSIWLFKVYPSVFTFYTISSLLLNTNILNKFVYYVRFILKKLRFKNQKNLNLFILSIFTGNPSSSGIIGEAIEKNELTVSNANNLLKCSSFQNPIFILAFLYPYSLKYALIVILVHVLSNLIITLYLNRKNEYTKIENTSLKFNFKELLKSINNVIYILLIISSMMVFSNIIIYSISTALDYLNLKNTVTILILSQLEISRGMTSIISLNLDNILFYLIVTFTVAFNGLSIHLQVYNIISKYNLKYKNFFNFRIIQGVISVILLIIFFLIEKSLIILGF